jgi:hypothetical protein
LPSLIHWSAGCCWPKARGGCLAHAAKVAILPSSAG